MGGVARGIGRVFGGGGGGSGGQPEPGVQTVQSSNKPWAQQQPYLKSVFKEAFKQYKRPLRQFPGETFVGFSPETEEALQATAARARAGSPLTQAAQEQLQRTIQGDIVSEPQFQRQFSQLARQVTPRIQSQFALRGRSRGGAMQDAQTRALGDIFTNLYGQERQRQLSAARLAPALAGLDYADIGRLASVGSEREELRRAQIQNRLGRYRERQAEPLNRLQRYAALVAGGSFGSEGTQQIPYARQPSQFGRNLLGGALAGGILGAGPLGFGGLGTGLSAGVGGLLGGFL